MERKLQPGESERQLLLDGYPPSPASTSGLSGIRVPAPVTTAGPASSDGDSIVRGFHMDDAENVDANVNDDEIAGIEDMTGEDAVTSVEPEAHAQEVFDNMDIHENINMVSAFNSKHDHCFTHSDFDRNCPVCIQARGQRKRHGKLGNLGPPP